MGTLIKGEANERLKAAAFAELRRFFREVCEIETDCLEQFFDVLDRSVSLALQEKVAGLQFEFGLDEDREEVWVVVKTSRGLCFDLPPAQVFRKDNPFCLKRSALSREGEGDCLRLTLGKMDFLEQLDIRNTMPAVMPEFTENYVGK